MAGVVRAALWLLLPILILQVFDRAVPALQADDLLPFAVAVFIALCACSLLDLAASMMSDSLQRVRNRAADWRAIQALFGRDDLDPGLDNPAGATASELPFVCRLTGIPVLLAAIIYLAGVLAVPAVILAALSALSAAFFQRRLTDTPETHRRRLMPSVLDAVWTIKAMGAEQLVLRLAEDEHRKHAASGKQSVGWMISADRLAAVFDRVTVVLSVLLGSVLALNELVTLGQFVSAVLISVFLVRETYWGTVGYMQSRRSGAGAKESSGDISADISDEPLPRVTGNLMLNRVSLEEPADGVRAVSRILFDRVRVEIDAGEAVLIKGGDVHMQSALLRLMAGLERPASGTVTVDGYDLAGFRPDSIRRQVAYVPPLGRVIPGSLMENLTGFDSGRTADAMGAARLTGMDAKAASLTDGFDTFLQEGAPGFPAGFRQHLAITRALASKPRILLLDQATENLDSQDLRVFSDVLERLKGRVTIVFTSTQAGLRAMADRAIDLDGLEPAPEIGPAIATEEDAQTETQAEADVPEADTSKDGEV